MTSKEIVAFNIRQKFLNDKEEYEVRIFTNLLKILCVILSHLSPLLPVARLAWWKNLKNSSSYYI